MSNAKPDLGETRPARHPSGRVQEPPISIAQAKARVVQEMEHLDESCRVGLDVGYAARCLEEVLEDLWTILIGA